MARVLGRSFFARNASVVARELIGQKLVRRVNGQRVEATIVSTEAFEGGAGAGQIRKGMLYEPGTIFVMSHRGNHYLNIATDAEDKASCVMVRAVEAFDALVDGPGRVGKALTVKDLDGLALGAELNIERSAATITVEAVRGEEVAENSLGRFRRVVTA